MSIWIASWLERHQHPVSRGLHFLAIPLMPVAAVVAMTQLIEGAWSLWWRPVGLLAVSYAVQWVGHVVEGNDMGEMVLIKKWLGHPYVAVAPRYRRDSGDAAKRGPVGETR